MDTTTREEVRIGRDEYLSLVRDREILDVIEAARLARGDCPEPFRAQIGALLDAGIPANVIVGRSTAAATRQAAMSAALRAAAPRTAALVDAPGSTL